MTENELFEYLAGKKYVEAGGEAHQAMHIRSQKALRIINEINNSYHTPDELRLLMLDLTDKAVDSTFAMFPPFYSECGHNITFGKNCFVNIGCTFQDWGGITFGNGCLIGQNCTICTVNHDQCPDKRGSMTFASVVIGNHVWIGANVTILPGVSVGDGAIIAAGAIVNKNVKENEIVGGIPARHIKYIYEND